MKQFLGYVLGFSIFIVGIPALMWWVAGVPSLADLPVGRLYLAALIALAGLALIVWRPISARNIWIIRNGPGALSRFLRFHMDCDQGFVAETLLELAFDGRDLLMRCA